jgi:hypothetical protein
MLRRVALVIADISEELSPFFVRVTRIGELGTSDSCHPDDVAAEFLQNIGSYKSHTA